MNGQSLHNLHYRTRSTGLTSFMGALRENLRSYNEPGAVTDSIVGYEIQWNSWECLIALNLTSNENLDPNLGKNLYTTLNCFKGNQTEVEGQTVVRAALVGVVLGLITLATTVGNVLVLAAIFTNTFFRNTTHYFIANLAVADLLVGITVLPFSASLEILDYWAFGQVMCDIWAAADVLCCTASIFSLCVISVDRYIGVTRPLQHGTIINEARAVYIILIVWLMSFAISVAPLFGWKEPPSEDPRVCEVTKQTGYVLFSVSGSFYIPLIVILIVYYRVYREATNQSLILEGGMMIARSGDIALRIHFGRTNLSTATASGIGGGGGGGSGRGGGGGSGGSIGRQRSHRHRRRRRGLMPLPLSSSSTQQQQPNRSRPSLEFLPHRPNEEKTRRHSPTTQLPNNKSLANKIAKFNREKKAAKTLGIVVGVFIGCWFPFFFVLPLEVLCSSCTVPVWLFKIIFWLGYCNSLMNPIIYACSSREFQQAFLRILRCSRFRHHRQQPQFLRQTFLALQSVHATSASIATNFGYSSRRLAVGVSRDVQDGPVNRNNSVPTSPVTDLQTSDSTK